MKSGVNLLILKFCVKFFVREQFVQKGKNRNIKNFCWVFIAFYNILVVLNSNADTKLLELWIF